MSEVTLLKPASHTIIKSFPTGKKIRFVGGVTLTVSDEIAAICESLNPENEAPLFKVVYSDPVENESEGTRQEPVNSKPKSLKIFDFEDNS